jgi:hypothetical protein
MNLQDQRTKKLMTILKGLGTGKNKVAENLKAKKIKGLIGEAYLCPVARYIKRSFPKASVGVGASFVVMEFSDKSEFEIDPPKAVGNFIREFDNNKYPELVMSLSEAKKEAFKKEAKKFTRAINVKANGTKG